MTRLSAGSEGNDILQCNFGWIRSERWGLDGISCIEWTLDVYLRWTDPTIKSERADR